MKALPDSSLRFWSLLTLLIVIPTWAAAAEPQEPRSLPVEADEGSDFGTATVFTEEGRSLRVSAWPAVLNDTTGDVAEFQVTGTTEGMVWGTVVYTSDSNLATAAVHAGVLADGQTGQVQITILPGRSQYSGSERNGVVSRSYGSWAGSFWIEPVGSQQGASGDSRQEVVIPSLPSY